MQKFFRYAIILILLVSLQEFGICGTPNEKTLSIEVTDENLIPDPIREYIPAVARAWVYGANASSKVPFTVWYIGNGIAITAYHATMGAAFNRISLAWGLKGGVNYVEEGRAVLPFSVNEKGERVDHWERPILPPNFQVERYLDGESIGDKSTQTFADITVLQLKKPWPRKHIPIGNLADTPNGHPLISLGYSYGYLYLATGELVDKGETLAIYDLPLVSGFSGAPILDLKTGKAVAIHARTATIPDRSPNASSKYLTVRFGSSAWRWIKPKFRSATDLASHPLTLCEEAMEQLANLGK